MVSSGSAVGSTRIGGGSRHEGLVGATERRRVSGDVAAPAGPGEGFAPVRDLDADETAWAYRDATRAQVDQDFAPDGPHQG